LTWYDLQYHNVVVKSRIRSYSWHQKLDHYTKIFLNTKPNATTFVVQGFYALIVCQTVVEPPPGHPRRLAGLIAQVQKKILYIKDKFMSKRSNV
jgi:hypothetical protein